MYFIPGMRNRDTGFVLIFFIKKKFPQGATIFDQNGKLKNGHEFISPSYNPYIICSVRCIITKLFSKGFSFTMNTIIQNLCFFEYFDLPGKDSYNTFIEIYWK